MIDFPRPLSSTRRVISHGSRGVSIVAANSPLSSAALIPACSVAVVDTTGAGDALAGALLYGESCNLDPIDSARRAVRIAAEVVTITGARLDPERVRAVWNQL